MAKTTSIEEILEKMLTAVGDSREKIFEIGEDSRSEYEQLKKELENIQNSVIQVISKTERTELHSRYARNRLAEVSKHFSDFSDEDVRIAYEQANDYQVKLAILRQEEKQLRDRRDLAEHRLMKHEATMERTELLVSQISVIVNYLTGDSKQVTEMVADAMEMQKLGLKIIEAQEEERKRLSREIHDGPAQTMANVMLRSELVERVYKEHGIDEALNEIRDLRMMVKGSLSEVRRIIYDLRPMALDDLGLIPALEKYLKHTKDHLNLKINFVNIGKTQRLPSEMEVALFRIIQEALQNVHKHAKATEVTIKIELKTAFASAVIKDNGEGFDTNIKKDGSFGLLGMRERVNMLDGKLTINSNLGKGTLILVQIPIKGEI